MPDLQGIVPLLKKALPGLRACVFAAVATLIITLLTLFAVAAAGNGALEDAAPYGSYQETAMSCVFLLGFFPFVLLYTAIYLRVADRHGIKCHILAASAASVPVVLVQCTAGWGTAASGLLISSNLAYYLLFHLPAIVFIAITSGAGLVQWLKTGPQRQHPLAALILAWGACSFMATVICQLQASKTVEMAPNYIIRNMFLYGILFAAVSAAYGLKARPAVIATILTAWFAGFANSQLLAWRGNVITLSDLLSLRTAMNVAGSYRLQFDAMTAVSGALAAACIVLAHVVKGRGALTRKKVWRFIAFETTLAIALCSLSIRDINTWNEETATRIYGYPLYFLSNAAGTLVKEPDGYYTGIAEAILDGYGEKDAVRHPDIIVVQDEAFLDLDRAYGIETDKEVLPFISSLSGNVLKGHYYCSTEHGPTANTEAEFLCRYSTAFTYGSTPFTQHVKKATPSVPYVLKNQDTPYRTIAFHPYYSSGYKRNTVYSLLGFDETVFYEDTERKETKRGLVTDRQDFLDVIAMHREHVENDPDTPLFIFNVTMQNHGGYDDEMPDFEDPVAVTPDDRQLAMCVNLVHETDRQFHLLTDYFSSCGRDVILLFYGDHAPHIELAESTDKTVKPDWDAEREVPYFIWANFSLDTETLNMDITSMNYMASTLFKLAGSGLTSYDSYLLSLQEQYPVVSAGHIVSADGTVNEEKRDVASADPGLLELSQLQYALMLDRNGWENREDEWELFCGRRPLGKADS